MHRRAVVDLSAHFYRQNGIDARNLLQIEEQN